MQITINILLKKPKLGILFGLLFCLSQNLPMFSQDKLRGITVTLSQIASSYSLDSPIELVFSVSNGHKEEQAICKYMTPIEGFYGSLLIVKNAAGERIPYKGILVKREAPKKESYLPLSPGEILTHQFVLTEAYPIEKKGVYTVQFKGSQYLNGLPDSEILEITVE